MATVKVLVVAAGGGGGRGESGNSVVGGGGGGGGVIYNSNYSVLGGTSYSITIGNGGSGGTGTDAGVNGGDSIFDTLTAIGGGGGGSYPSNKNGKNGGSGGGGSHTGTGGSPTSGQGYSGANGNGINNGGGGGGAGVAGSGKQGGDGYQSDISGTNTYYGGGGSSSDGSSATSGGQGGGGTGGVYNSSGSATAGGTNTGGGGGAGVNYDGKSGGSGKVIIRYVTADFPTCTGGTKTTVGSDTVHTFTSSGTFSIPAIAPSVTTTSATAGTLSIDAVGNVTSDGGATITERGFCYNISGTPTISDFKKTVSGTTGSYSTNISGLTGEITYHVRAYATNSVGTSYGAEIDVFVPGLPTITNSAVTNIDIVSATGNGNVTSDSGAVITERGFCWNTSTNPTTSNDKVIVSGTTGAYTGTLTPLDPNTLYYVRSYATNSYGTVYGTQVSFTTLALGAKQLVKNIGAIEGEIYAVQIKTNITSGTITVKLGTTGDSVVISGTGAVTTVLQGEYGGLSGLIVESSDGFVGTVDDIFWVLVLGTAVIDWDASTLTNLIPVNGVVKFRRVEDKEITRFDIYRYIDTLFKDLDGYITITVTEESNDLSADRSKTFVVGNTVGTPSPFVKKKISILSKNQAIILQYANNKLNETFTICSYSLTGFKGVRKLYKPDSIISI